jgi:hypothetical protein
MDSELNNQSEFLFYKAESGSVKVGVVIRDDTAWTTQKGLAAIFGVDVSTINYHIKEIFSSNELDENSVIRKIPITASDGKTYMTGIYNLDMIIAVGYRVNSYQATQFRIWATKVLKEYLIKGFALDDERLKQGTNLFDKDYFSELLERIREIRASERRFYQKITDLYATAADYDTHSPITHEFFGAVQNKLHFAIHHHTAAELIAERSDASKPNMGLTTWKNAKNHGKVIKSDVSTAKNYLTDKEIGELNRVVTMYLDYAENMASRGKEMRMVDWVVKLDSFLDFNEYDVLKSTGRMSAKAAKTLAEKEYEKYRPIQDREYKSDFDRTVEDIKSTGRLPEHIPTPKKELSDYDKKLKTALDYNPNANKG